MLIVPNDIRVGYAKFLTQKGVAQIYVGNCQKWLRYYLVFCVKYRYVTATSRGLDAFLARLTYKNQDDAARKEAQGAIQLYQYYLITNRIDNRPSKRPESVIAYPL